MSSTILERLRAAQEDVELYERYAVQKLDEKPKHHRARMLQGHAVSNVLNRIAERSEDALEIYADYDGIFEEEMESMTGAGIFTSFYDRLREIRDYHRRYPNMPGYIGLNAEEELNPDLKFSGEERFGKYVDLHQFYTRFLNMSCFIPVVKKQRDIEERERDSSSSSYKDHGPNYIEYVKYLTIVSSFDAIPQQARVFSPSYHSYLDDLLEYLLDFYSRTQPLVDLEDVIEEAKSEFEKKWALNKVFGWDSEDAQCSIASVPFCVLCDEYFETGRKFKYHVDDHHSNEYPEKTAKVSEMANIALKEVKIKKLCELLTEVLDATKSYLEVKQTRTHEELQAEIEEEEEGALADVDMDDDDDDEDAPFYNPLNLPLGWDGKPIPYWLYKLHGLGEEFKCEICGNHSYWGRRAFDRHFQEWRHAHGMRCLKIPNTKHFHDITLIEDAVNLYNRIKDQISVETWQAGDEEEFEDSEGNVLNKKTYEDLARQGLL